MVQLAPEERKLIAERGYIDPVFFCKTFLSHWFKDFKFEMPPLHKGILALLLQRADFLIGDKDLSWIEENFIDGRGNKVFVLERAPDGTLLRINLVVGKHLCLMLPRGMSKTTLCNAATVMRAVYQESKYIVPISNTATHSETQLGNICNEFTSNAALIEVFGQLKPERSSDLKWTDSFAQLTNGVTLAAKGRGAQVRGQNVNSNRPDWLLVDDLEDKESVETTNQRAKTSAWFYGDLLPALPQIEGDGRCIVIGTLLHTESLLMTLKEDPEWTFIKFSWLDANGQPVWPEVMPLERLEKLKGSFALSGNLSVFYLEYMSELINEETQKFKRDFFKYGQLENPLATALVIDPAISEDAKADLCAFAVVSMMENGRLWVREAFGKRGMPPHEQVDTYFQLQKQYSTNRNGVESIAYQAALVHLMREEMFRRGQYFEITKITHGRNKKNERVEGILQPRFANGYIIFAGQFPELERQLLDWPRGKKDIPDALAMAVALLDPYAAAAADPEVDLAAPEYKSPATIRTRI